ncbi:MAG: hypothetical protein KF795_03955 [Labilithrix sp.]|nr:hypothetical protein [Labilithrix sp.]
MKSSQTFASIFLLGTLAAAGACAEGSSTDATAIDFVEPTKSTEPTEPDDSVTVPPKGDDKPGADDDGADDDASSSGGSSGTPDAGGSSSGGPDAGGSSSGGPDAGGSSSGAPDAGSCATVAPSNVCGLAPQCGCASNQTCDVTNKSNGAVSCILAGGGPQGSLCTTSSQCAAGLTCAYGACRPYCATANTACAGAGLGMCGQYYDPPGTAVPNSKVCTITCNLRSPSAACGSNTCIWDGSVSATDCDAAGTVGVFEKCTKYNDCKQGMACINHAIFGFECEPWCRIGSNDCGIFSSCKDVYGAGGPMEGTTKLGHCQ